MTNDEAQEKVKALFDIPTATTTWDTIIDGLVVDVASSLYPIIKKTSRFANYELAANINEIALTDLDADAVGVRHIDIKAGTDGDVEFQRMNDSDWSVMGGYLVLHTEFDEAKTLRVWGWLRFALAGLPAQYHHGFKLLAAADFARYLAGNKRQYSSYVQQTGARAVDNMLDIADNYAANGLQELIDRADLEGD